MYRLRQMDVDDKVCEQVTMTMINEIYPKEVVERCVHQSQTWSSKKRRIRKCTALALVLFLIQMGLWSRLNQVQVWQKLVGKLSDLHPAEAESMISDSGLSGQRKVLGSQCLRTLFRERCQVIAQPKTMPSAFFHRYRLLGIDGTVFNLPDTRANREGFGRCRNQYGPGAYPQARCVLLVECGSHATIGLQIDRQDVSEIKGAYSVLSQVGPNTLVLTDAGITSAGFFEQVRAHRAQGLGALECGRWKHLDKARRLSDGSVLGQLRPTPKGQAVYPLQKPLWVRIISYRITDERLGEIGQVYRLATTLLNPVLAPALELIALYHERWEVELVIDEIKTHERAQRKVLRSKTPEGVIQELYGIFLAHYAVRWHMAQAAMDAGLDPDRLSFTASLFQLTEMMDLALILEPNEATQPLFRRLHRKLIQQLLPPRRLRINRREVKQVYCKYKPKKRDVPPPEPFEPDEQFLDFVQMLDPFAPALQRSS
jgi:hypothetical protein